MANNTEVAKAIIDIDGKVASEKLKELAKDAKKFRQEMDAAKFKGDNAAFQKAKEGLSKVTKESDKLKRSTTDLNNVLKNLSGSSMKELERAQRRLTYEIKASNRATDEEKAALKQKAAQLKLVDAELTKVRHEMNLSKTVSQSFASQLANGLNKYFLAATATVASFTAVLMGSKKAISTFAEWDDKVADVQKTTQLTREQVVGLNEDFKDIDTRSAQLELLDLARVAGKLGITAENDVEGFVRAADKIKVALSEDLGGDVEESINQVGKLVDIFKVKDEFGIENAMIKTGSAINALGAASTANEGYLVEFTKRVAGVAPTAGISLSNVLGLAATLDQLGQQSETSSTVFSTIIPDMFRNTAAYAKVAGMDVKDFAKLLKEDANEAMIRLLEGLNGNNAGMENMVKVLDSLGIEGKRSVSVLGVLANNTEVLRQQQTLSNTEFVKGTSILNEFNTKNNTVQAGLDKAKKKLYDQSVELGERLAPALMFSTNSMSYLIKAMNTSIKFFIEYKGVIVPATLAIVAYATAVNAAAIKKAVFTAATKVADLAVKAFNTTMKASPWGITIAAVTALVSAFIMFRNRIDDTKKKISEFNETVADSVAESNVLFDQLKKTAEGTDERRAAIAKLREIHGDYLKDLDLERASLEEIEKAQKGANEELVKKIALDAKTKDLTIWAKKEVEIRRRIAELGFNVDDILKERANPKFNSFGKPILVSYGNEIDNLLMNLTVVQDEMKKVGELYDTMITSMFSSSTKTTTTTGDPDPDDPITKYEELSKKIEDARKKLQEFAMTGNMSEALKTGQVLKELEEAKRIIDYIIDSKGDIPGAIDKIRIAEIDNGISDNKGVQPLDNDYLNVEPQPVKGKKYKEPDNGFNKEYYLNGVETMLDAGLDIYRNKADERFDYEMAKLDEQMNRELSNKNLTEAQKEKIRIKYEAKERKLKQDSWKKQHKADIVSSIIKTALAVLTQLSGGDPYTAAARAWEAGIAGAAQTTVIASQKMPKFYYGGDTGSGIGVRDNNNRQIAGFVHPREYVIPEWMRSLPMVMNFERVMEGIRTGRQGGYYDGGSTGVQSSKYKVQSSAPASDNGLKDSIDRLNLNLEKGIKAKLIYQEFEEFTGKVDSVEKMAQI